MTCTHDPETEYLTHDDGSRVCVICLDARASELEQQLTHLQEMAGDGSCADFAVKMNARASEYREALEEALEALDPNATPARLPDMASLRARIRALLARDEQKPKEAPRAE